MRNRPTGTCPLCLNERELCYSHLLPAATFKALRDKKKQNPNPIRFSEHGKAYTSSKPVIDYLLCYECEQRLHVGGEDWVLSNGQLTGDSFPIREALRAAKPIQNFGEISLYVGSSIASIDCEKLIHFGMGIFWKSAARNWQWDHEQIGIDLGPYQESIRRFLLGDAPFPGRMALAVRISSLTTLWQTASFPQQSVNTGVYHRHHFTIPGLKFILATGQGIEPAVLKTSTAPAPERYLAIYPQGDVDELRDVTRIAQESRPAKGFR
jgi:hypothetical protein